MLHFYLKHEILSLFVEENKRNNIAWLVCIFICQNERWLCQSENTMITMMFEVVSCLIVNDIKWYLKDYRKSVIFNMTSFWITSIRYIYIVNSFAHFITHFKTQPQEPLQLFSVYKIVYLWYNIMAAYNSAAIYLPYK